MFVTFEGLDGSGKTTQVELLREHLEAQGREVVVTREPGGTPLGERIRELVLAGTEMTPWSEAALFTAARAELVHRVIRPALERGAVVLCDRYIDSSLAYQGIARGLGIEPILMLNLTATGGLLPSRTFLLAIPAAAALDRFGDSRDRIEREEPRFHRQVEDAYGEIARRYPDRIVVLDGARPAAELAGEIRERLRDAA